MRLSLYAIVPAGPPLDAPDALGEGVQGERLYTVPLGTFAALAAVVGEVDGRPSLSPATLRAHEDVVERLRDASDALLPLGFGAIVTDTGELRRALAPRLDALTADLERTRGCDQMTVRISGTGADVDRVRRALDPLARASREDRRASRLATTVFHLVERARVPEYLALADLPHVDVTGPWPPYAFTDLG